MTDENDDVPQLSAETFAALQEFYKEQEEKNKTTFDVTTQVDIQITEDWQLSQFWYDQKTIETLTSIALKAAGPNGKIALISCPSLYKGIKQKHTSNVVLLEFDQRFSAFGLDYIFYDYKQPLNISRDLINTFDVVIADPPFLSEECLTKTAVTIKFLTTQKIILCTGAVMEDLVKKLLNLKKCLYQPQHKNNLANAFACYSNIDIDSLILQF